MADAPIHAEIATELALAEYMGPHWKRGWSPSSVRDDTRGMRRALAAALTHLASQSTPAAAVDLTAWANELRKDPS